MLNINSDRSGQRIWSCAPYAPHGGGGTRRDIAGRGRAGIGKSRFLKESATAATARGFTLAWGQADAHRILSSRPLAPPPGVADTRGPGGGRRRERPVVGRRACRPAGRRPGAAHGGKPAAHGGQPDAGPAGRPGMRRSRHALEPRGLARRPQTRPPLWLLARSTASAYSDAQWLFTHLEHAGAARP